MDLAQPAVEAVPATKRRIAIALGTANFGVAPTKTSSIGPQTVAEGKAYLDVLREFNVAMLDTARSYSDGTSEELLRELDAPGSFQVCTKAAAAFDGGGTRDAILTSWEASKKALGVDKVHMYYLHTPDRKTPLGETVNAIGELHKAGRFDKFGVSNLRVAEVLALHDHASSHGLVLPSAYQGNYSVLSRSAETELLPALRRLGVAFHAYSPLCCGLLVDGGSKLAAAEGRWDRSHMGGAYMQSLYNKPAYVRALAGYARLCAERALDPAGVGYRWVAYHSALRHDLGDAMIVGASGPGQLRGALAQLDEGPLDQDLVDELQKLWESVAAEAPRYHV